MDAGAQTQPGVCDHCDAEADITFTKLLLTQPTETDDKQQEYDLLEVEGEHVKAMYLCAHCISSFALTASDINGKVFVEHQSGTMMEVELEVKQDHESSNA